VAPPKTEKFETTLEKLEELVQKLEEGDLPLEDSLKAFEEGMTMVKSCEKRLNEAQKKIEILMKDGKTKDFEVEGQ
jgi:exodeoxyribonuclease VII small subunit